MLNVSLINGAKLSSYAPKYETARRTNDTKKAKELSKTKVETVGSPKLSKKAQEIYDKLKEKYSSASFVLVDSSKMDEVKENPLKFDSTSPTSVFIDEKELEKMAQDSEYALAQENRLGEALDKIPELKNELDKLGAPVTSMGLVIEEGKTKYFAQLEPDSKNAIKEFENKNEKARLNRQRQRAIEIRKKFEPVKRPSDETMIIKHTDHVTVITDSFMDLTAAVKEAGGNYFVRTDTGVNINETV